MIKALDNNFLSLWRKSCPATAITGRRNLTGTAFVSPLMSVNRFVWLLSHLHFNDNSVQPPRGDLDHDRLYKLRPVLTRLALSFAECYHAHKKLVVDESMVKFKGRSSLKQYMRD